MYSEQTMLLLALNARYTHTNLAVRSLRASCQVPGWRVLVRESSINQTDEAVADLVAAESPQALGISVYIWNSAMVRRLVPLIRERMPGVTIILGGPEVSYSAERWLADCPAVDVIVTGPGEAALPQLLAAGCAGPRRVVTVPSPPLDELPFPYGDDDLAHLTGRYVYYESSRGCPFRCSYCLSSRQDQAPQFRGTGRVLDELARIMWHGPGTVKFVDRSFNCGDGRHRDIWRGIISSWGGGTTSFHFEIHPSLLTEDDFAVLDSCPPGLFRFEIGVQSVNDATLAAIDRRQNWERARPAIARLTDPGAIHCHVDLIAGLPFDTFETIARGVDEVMALRPHHCQLGFLKLLPGTAMDERRHEYGMIADETAPYQVRQNRWLTAAELRRLEEIALLIDRCWNSGHFAQTMALLKPAAGSWFRLFSIMAESRGSDGGPLTRSWEEGAAVLLAAGRALTGAGPVREALDADWRRLGRPGPLPRIIYKAPQNPRKGT